MVNKIVSRNIDTPYLPEKEAAAYLGMKSSRTLQNMRWKGGGPAFLKQGRRVIYRIEDLEQWLRQRAVRKTRNAEEGTPMTDFV